MEKKSNRQSETPKVHQSCDVCQTSKIRCGKERPACRRCVKHNLDCVYSISRRNGRPRSCRTGSGTPSAQISRQASQGPHDIQNQTVPPTPTSPVGKICGQVGPSPEFVAPDPSFRISIGPSNATRSFNFPSETQRDESFPENSNRPDVHGQTLYLGPYGGAATDLTGASYTPLSFFDHPTNTLQCDSSAFTFTPMLSPTHTRSDTDTSQVFRFDYFGVNSEPAWTNLPTATSCQSGEIPGDPTNLPAVCSCSTLLLNQLSKSASSMRDVQMNGTVIESISYAFALQGSTVLLDLCFNVLCCTQCRMRPSSALLLCQAMDVVSLLLGMGSVWGEINLAQLLCSTNLPQEEMLMRCGTYTVRRTDQCTLLQTLMMKRMTEMQRTMNSLDKILKMEDAASSSCQEVYASMVTELKVKVTSTVDQFRTIM